MNENRYTPTKIFRASWWRVFGPFEKVTVKPVIEWKANVLSCSDIHAILDTSSLVPIQLQYTITRRLRSG